jgi:YHS domain-containing protein
MQVDEKKAAGSSKHHGVEYFFCSAGCKEAFDKNPEKFTAAQHAGKT